MFWPRRFAIRVLLVEDDEADALLVGYALEEMSNMTPRLTHACDAKSAETHLERGGFDVVLLDMGLPDAHGLEGLTRLQKCAPDVPIILLTGFNGQAHALQSLQSGAEDYLVKGKTDAPLLERSMRYAIERKRNERALLQLVREQVARQEAEAANRAKDDFLATISHELRTPLSAILGWASLLRDGALDETTARQAVETIERNALVQARLIEDLLDVSRIIAGHFQLQTAPVVVADIVALTVETLRPNAQEKEIALHLELDCKLKIDGDAMRLQQIVWNLLSNAIKFTPENGHVFIELRCEPNIEYSMPEKIAADEKTVVILTVRDSGQGIARDFLPHVFERFRQADSSTTRRHNGLGLGLSIARNLVEMHGGTIEVESEGENLGTVFTVRFPLLAPPKTE